MAKNSAAKIKMEAAEIKRAAAARREEKKQKPQSVATNGTAEIDRYEAVDVHGAKSVYPHLRGAP